LAAAAAFDKDEWLVEKILDHRLSMTGGGMSKKNNKKSYQFLVRWQGFSEEENTWEDYSNIGLENEELDAYIKRTPSLQKIFPKEKS